MAVYTNGDIYVVTVSLKAIWSDKGLKATAERFTVDGQLLSPVWGQAHPDFPNHRIKAYLTKYFAQLYNDQIKQALAGHRTNTWRKL